MHVCNEAGTHMCESLVSSNIPIIRVYIKKIVKERENKEKKYEYRKRESTVHPRVRSNVFMCDSDATHSYL